ncbi:MAG: hypothetical protein GXZ15_02935 [Campylobacter sp.]|nr:hypothetical protein [Campylobacter sp.]
MRYLFRLLLLLNLILTLSTAENFSDFSAKDLDECNQTIHIALNVSGKELMYCSLGELAHHAMSEDLLFSSIKVKELISGEFVDANLVHYVLDGDEIYAFNKEEDALRVSSNLMSLNDAFDVAYELESSKILSLKYKNLKKFYPMGERIYKTFCPKISTSKFAYISDLKREVFRVCTDENGKILDDRKASLVTNFLWANLSGEAIKFSAKDDEKCPVCGMFVYKYPRWAVVFGELDSKKRLVFDGVKDAMKFYFNSGRYANLDFKFEKGYVTDYYTGNMIDIKEAFFVLGSDVLGPMGYELVPFSNLDTATEFKLEHRGRDIYTFDQIDECVMLLLEGKNCE